jgi:hypothetical protein
MPFTLQQFLDIFSKYNNAVFPAQIILFLLAASSVYIAAKDYDFKNKFIGITLSFLWLWTGVVYHLLFFTKINKGAYLFALLFIIQAILFFRFSVLKKSLRFKIQKSVYSYLGLVLIAYGLIIYPLLNIVFGHLYPASPTFGLPCPTTIFTLGILLCTNKSFPKYLLVIPVVWSLIGFTASLMFGIYEDIGLLVSAIITVPAIILRDKRSFEVYIKSLKPQQK